MAPEDRREQLLDAAIAIIVRDGYGRVTIEAIAREAGVTRPVVYSAFDGLTPLLYALLDRQEERALEQLSGVLAENLDHPDPLSATVHALVEIVRDDPLTWRPILFAPADTPEAVRGRIAHDHEVVRKRLAALLDATLRPGASPKLDTEVLSHALLAVLEHFGRVILDQPGRFQPERLIAATRQILPAIQSSAFQSSE